VEKAIHEAFADWLSGPLGQTLLQEEQANFQKLLKDQHFSVGLTVGESAYQPLTQDIAMVRQIIVSACAPEKPMNDLAIAEAESLPVMPNNIDLLVLPHTLDFTQKPHRVLREANHCLRAEGRLVIIGFNPFSLWGLRQLFSLRQHAPWSGRFRPMWKVMDWLRLLNYKVTARQYCVYRLPIKERKLYKHFKFLRILLSWLFPFFGGVYIIVARKRVLGLTPLRPRWKKLTKALSNGTVNPMRGMKRDRDC